MILLTPYPTNYDIRSLQRTLPRHMRTKLAQLIANKLPLLKSYLHVINSNTCMPQCSLCLAHYTNYLLTVFKCQHTTLQ